MLKSLYEFTIKEKTQVEEITDTPEGKLTKMVDKEVPVRVLLKKPTRAETEKAEETYARELSRCIRAGIMPEALMVKFYAQEGGIFTESEQQEYSGLLLSYVERQNEYQRAVLSEDSPEKEARVKKLTEGMIVIQTRLQDFKRAQQSLFNQTAEKKASDKTILFLTTQLTYVAKGDEDFKPLFKGKDFEAKLAEVDENEDNEFFVRLFQRALLFIMFWHMGNAEKPEDFKEFEKSIDQPPLPVEETPPS